MSLANKTIVVVGGSSGMGLATARAALAEGAKVVITGRSHERLQAAKTELGNAVREVAVDAGDEAGMRSLFEGLGQVDHVYSTVASLLFNPRLAGDTAAVRDAMDTRLWGSYYIAKYAAPKMPPEGSITFTTGTAAQRPLVGMSIITASCGAVEALARALAVELAPIRVNAIQPGAIDTPLIEKSVGKERAARMLAQSAARAPLKRVGRAEEVADAVLFLMKNQFVTGITLTIDGGMSLL